MSDKEHVSIQKCLKDEFEKTSNGKISRILFFPLFRIVTDITEALATLKVLVLYLYFLIFKPMRQKKNGIKASFVKEEAMEVNENSSPLEKKVQKVLQKKAALFLINNLPFVAIAYLIHNINMPFMTKVIFVAVGVILLLNNIVILRKAVK